MKRKLAWNVALEMGPRAEISEFVRAARYYLHSLTNEKCFHQHSVHCVGSKLQPDWLGCLYPKPLHSSNQLFFNDDGVWRRSLFVKRSKSTEVNFHDLLINIEFFFSPNHILIGFFSKTAGCWATGVGSVLSSPKNLDCVLITWP